MGRFESAGVEMAQPAAFGARRTILHRSAALALTLAAGAGLSTATAAAQALELPTGRLRMAINLGNTAVAAKDPDTGELRGIDVEMGRALAARLGVPFEPVEYATVPQVVEGFLAGQFDVFSQTVSELTDAVDASAPFAEIDNTYVVPAGSPIQRVADADRPGVRIAVGRGAGPDVFLSEALQRATLVRADTGDAAFDLLRAGQVDAVASNRPNALAFAVRLPGARVLADRFTTQQRVLAVPKGRPALYARLRAFVEEAKASGLVRQVIARAGARGVQEAGPMRLPATGTGGALTPLKLLVVPALLASGALGFTLRCGRRIGQAPVAPSPARLST
jgi:polar amino acid transport system substrate-binding protein